MKEIRDLIDQLGRTFETFKSENDRRIASIEAKGYAPADVVEKVEKINKDLEEIAAMKRQLEALETAIGRGGGGGGKSELDRAKAEHAVAFEKYFRKGVEAGLKDLEIKAALSTLSDPDGGFLVPEEMAATIDRIAAAESAMRRLATVQPIGTDTWKKLVSMGVSDAGWVAEKASRTETDTPTLKEIAINTKELYSNPAITQGSLDDSRIDVEAWLGDEVSTDFNEQEGEAFISGNGVGEPKGIGSYTMVANASYAWGSIGYIAGGHESLLNNADKLIDLQHALKRTYRNGAAWLMNDTTCSKIRTLKDGEGNYLWRPGLAEGAPDVLLGKPVEYDDNVDDIGAGKYPVWFGNWKRGYLIVDRFGIRVLRDPYTNKPYVHFYTTKRVGGGVVMYEALKALKIAKS